MIVQSLLLLVHIYPTYNISICECYLQYINCRPVRALRPAIRSYCLT